MLQLALIACSLTGLVATTNSVSIAPAVSWPAHAGEQTDELNGTADPARDAVARGAEAFARADYRTAIAAFETALAHRPSPKLHYNIAVCHQRLAAQTRDSEAAAFHADQAIISYNAYLLGAPEADDRNEVAALIEDLGGTVARPGLKDDIFATLDDEPPPIAVAPSSTTPSDNSSSDEPGLIAEDDGPPNAESSTPAKMDSSDSPAPLQRRGEIQLVLALGATPGLRSDQIEGEATGLLAVTALAAVRAQLSIGGALSLYGGGNNTPEELVLSGGHMTFTTSYARMLGKRRRLRLSGGGDLGLARQAVRSRATAPAPMCTTALGNEALVGARHGFLVALRGSVGVLLGQRRRHTVAMHLTPALGIYGRGTSAHDDATCNDGQRPLEALGLSAGGAGFIWLGVGYGVGF